MNRCHISENKIYFTPFDSIPFELCNIEEINIVNNSFIWDNQCYNLDERFEEENEILIKWNETFPNGKVEEVVEVIRVVSEEEKLKDMVNILMETYLSTFPTE